MPELAEVELARRIWAAAEKEIITEVHCHPKTRVYRDTPAVAIQANLTGARLLNSASHGKRLLFNFEKKEGSKSILFPLEVHLGMSGRLALAPPDHLPHKHDHLILRTLKHSLVYNDYRQFGRAHLHEDPAPWKDLPHEVLSHHFTTAHLRTLLSRRSRTSLKAFLLDQNCCPGIGNWMADEICWRLLLHPATPTVSLDTIALRRELRFVTRGALRHVADKNENLARNPAKGFAAGSYVAQVPPSSWLFQHRWKAGGHCPKCKIKLARDTIASRTTAWCPHCQPTSRI